MINTIDKGYKDVTNEWLKSADLKNSKIIFDDYFMDDKVLSIQLLEKKYHYHPRQVKNIKWQEIL